MNYAIEVPGEAAPLNPQNVLGALQSASSTQQHLIQSGTKQLEIWQAQAGFYALLQQAFTDYNLPMEIRYLAIIQLKNGIDRQWRKSSPHAIPEDEKATIRSRLISAGIQEPDLGLARQNALAVAKAVRIDYPLVWTDALTDLIASIRSNASDPQRLRRGLLILLEVTKELSTARIRRSQTSLQAATPEIVMLLGHVYTETVSNWLSVIQDSRDDLLQTHMMNSLFVLKILRRLLIAGYERPHIHTEVKQIWSTSQEHFGQFLNLLSVPSLKQDDADILHKIIEKHIMQFAKLHVDMASDHGHATSFVLLPNSLSLAQSYWTLIEQYGDKYASTEPISNGGGGNQDRTFMDRLCLKGMVLIRHCFKLSYLGRRTFKHRSPEIIAEDQEATDILKTQLLTDALVCQIANIIVTKFFVFRRADLDAWEEEPDEWEIREEGGGDTWEFEIRPCSEKLFMDLVINRKELLMEPLLGFFNSVSGPGNTDAIVKDSVYTAMGLSAPVVYPRFDFDNFIATTLVHDLQLSGSEYKVLRRRIAILIGQWVVVNCEPEKRALIYEIFQHLLNDNDPTNDSVVRITAARQLGIVVGDFGFEPLRFLPYADNLLKRLMALLQEVEPVETKMAILESLRVIATRLELDIIPFADDIVTLLPTLWESSGEEHLMKQAILTLLATLITAMKDKSVRFHGLVLPLIYKAVNDPEMQVYLLEESLELWSVILQQTPSPASPDLISLADSAFPLLELGSDNLRMVLVIVESYTYLAPDAMLSDGVRLRLLSYVTNLLDVTKRDLAGLVTSIAENMIMSAARIGGAAGLTIVIKDLVETGYIEKILAGLHDAWTASQTSGPNRRHAKIDDVVETDYFTILARIALADPRTFFSLLETVGDVVQTWAWLSSEWFRHFDSMASSERMKLSCLALTNLLSLAPPITPLILSKLQDYFAMWTTSISDLHDSDGGNDTLVWTTSATDEEFPETPEDERKRRLKYEDDVHKISTFEFVKGKLGELIDLAGGEEVFQREWCANVDADVVSAFQNLGRSKE